MLSGDPTPTPADLGENGDCFEVWQFKRLFDLLAPVCRLGLALALLFLCFADTLYYFLDLWSCAVPHAWLLVWHATMATFFALVVWTTARVRRHHARQHLLRAFVAVTSPLFVWFSVVSLLGTGDLFIVAVAQMLIASVLCLPGNFRRWAYGLQALATGSLLTLLDDSGHFIGQMQFVNPLVIAAVAFAMDGYMLKNSHALFTEKSRVVRERQRANAVLYNALPPDVAKEIKTHHRFKAQNHPAMAILFADIVGFTSFAAQCTPGQVLTVLNALFSEMDALVDTHQVEKIKTIGDAYMWSARTVRRNWPGWPCLCAI